MKVGFDAHMVGQNETGNETYALGLLAGFHEVRFPVHAYALVPLPQRTGNVHRVWPHSSLVRVPLTMPFLAARDRLDVYHATYVLPPFLPCRGIVTVHDITFTMYPEWFSPHVHRMLSFLVPLSLRRAERVITISECSKRDIVQRYSIPPEKVSVTYLAPRPAFSTPRTPLATPKPYFLYVGNVEPRKNVETVLRAMHLLRHWKVDVQLVVAGRLGLEGKRVEALIRSLHLVSDVELTGYVSDLRLRELFASCLALVHPAHYEGFGLTPLEAMAQGVPAIVSNAASLPEVVGDAAWPVAPTDVEGWAEAMRRIVEDGHLREKMAKDGIARAARFSWRRCARETIDVYRSVLDETNQYTEMSKNTVT